MTWFQKLLLAIPYTLYVAILVYFLKGSLHDDYFLVSWFLQILAFIFLAIGVPFIAAIALGVFTSGRVSLAGGMILANWSFLGGVIMLFGYFKIKGAFSGEKPSSSFVTYSVTYSDDREPVNKATTAYVKQNLVTDAHILYYQWVHFVKDTASPYVAYYCYGKQEELQEEDLSVARLLFNKNGEVTGQRIRHLRDDKVAHRDYQYESRFMAEVEKTAGDENARIDTTLIRSTQEIFSDTLSLEMLND